MAISGTKSLVGYHYSSFLHIVIAIVIAIDIPIALITPGPIISAEKVTFLRFVKC
jgi:hypothetical protein